MFEADLWPAVEQAKKSIAGVAGRDYIAVGGEVPGCDRYEEDFLVPPSVSPNIEAGVEEDAAVVIYTSGTTGKPKGAVRKFPKDALAVGDAHHRARRRCASTTSTSSMCPLYHGTAFAFIAMIAHPRRHRRAPGRVQAGGLPRSRRALRRHADGRRPDDAPPRPRARPARPSQRYDTRSLRGDLHRAARRSPGRSPSRSMDQFGDMLFNFYGATETGLVTLAKPADLARRARHHRQRVIPGNEIRLLDDNGREVAVGRSGRALRAEQDARRRLPQRRRGDPRQHARRLLQRRRSRAPRPRRALLHRGPQARHDHLGRRQRVPRRGRGRARGAPRRAEVAVVGIDDPEWGERVRAFVVLRARQRRRTRAELKAGAASACRARRCRATTSSSTRSRGNPTGKVLKRELRG